MGQNEPQLASASAAFRMRSTSASSNGSVGRWVTFGGLRSLARVRLDPARVFAEPEKAAEALEAFHRGQCGVGPLAPKCPQRGDVELLEQADALRPTERKELASEQLAPFLNRGRGQMTRRGVLEVQLDGAPFARLHGATATGTSRTEIPGANGQGRTKEEARQSLSAEIGPHPGR